MDLLVTRRIGAVFVETTIATRRAQRARADRGGRGVITGIVGPNGAGKSTLLKGVLDLVPRVSGSVSIYGKPYRQQRRLVAYVPQRESVDWDYPVSACRAGSDSPIPAPPG